MEFYENKPKKPSTSSSKVNCSLVRMTTKALARSKNFSVIIKHPSKKNNRNNTIASTTIFKYKHTASFSTIVNNSNSKSNDSTTTASVNTTSLKDKNLSANVNESNKKIIDNVSTTANSKESSTVDTNSSKKYITRNYVQCERKMNFSKTLNTNSIPIVKDNNISTITQNSKEVINSTTTVSLENKKFSKNKKHHSEKVNSKSSAILIEQNLSANESYMESIGFSAAISTDKNSQFMNKHSRRKKNRSGAIAIMSEGKFTIKMIVLFLLQL